MKFCFVSAFDGSYFESFASNSTLDVAVFHVVNVAQKLQFVVHGRDHSVQTVGDESNLLGVVSIARQGIDGDSGKLGEVLVNAGSLLEKP